MTAQPDPAFFLDGEPDYDSEPPELLPEEADALDTANWHLRCVAGIRRRADEVSSNFDAEIARLEIRRDAKLGTIEREEAWHARPLEQLARAMRERDPKRATITLACGSLKLTKQQPTWSYSGEVSEKKADASEEAAGEREFCVWAVANGHEELVAPTPVTFKVPVASLLAVLETVEGMRSTGLILDPKTDAVKPDKAAVKKALVKKSHDGKHTLALGVDPETNEKPKGLTVEERPHKFEVVDLGGEDEHHV